MSSLMLKGLASLYEESKMILLKTRKVSFSGMYYSNKEKSWIRKQKQDFVFLLQSIYNGFTMTKNLKTKLHLDQST